MSARALPALAALTATLAWGGMFPVFSLVLGRLDAFQTSAERYGFAALVLLAILAAREGFAALSFDGRAREIALLGLAGFTGFNIFLLLGVRAAGPEHGALVMATVPALALVVQALRTRVMPPPARIPFVLTAFCGVALVVTAGHGVRPGSALGDIALLAAALCWVAYTIGAGALRGWSPLRFTALSATAGAAGLILLAGIALALGVSHRPSASDFAATAPAMAYLVLFGAVYAVVAWTTAVRGLGPQRAALFMNLVPVTAFVIATLLGNPPVQLELLGAAMTVLALIGDNVVSASLSRLSLVRAA
jgi:drug/metabolite transporter (DMT)-like permease